MASCAVATFVKTPGLSPVKTRLAAGTSGEFALQCYEHCLNAIESVVSGASKANPVLVPYWAVAERDAMSHRRWEAFEKIEQGSGELGDRVATVWQGLQAKHDSIILLAADSPQLSVAELLHALRLIQRDASNEFVIGPTNDGGFYLFGGSEQLLPEFWRSVPWSTDNTSHYIVQQLERAGQPAKRLRPLSDLDLITDIDNVLSEIRGVTGPTSAQDALADFLKGSRSVGGAVPAL